MAAATANITKRIRRRKLGSGKEIEYVRYVLNFRDPITGRRTQRFFERHKDALVARDAIAPALRDGSYRDPKRAPTVAEAVERWLEDRSNEVKPRSHRYYQLLAEYITGPLLIGTPQERGEFKATGALPEGARFKSMLGSFKVTELGTGDIRAWHKALIEEVGNTSANKAKSALATVLALAAEDYNVHVPPLPRRIGRGVSRPKKLLLTFEQVRNLLAAAQTDPNWGIYYAWPFLTGTRPSEQLAVLWSEIDFARDVVRICRMQEINGSLTEVTKTDAGMREIPVCSLLKSMLLHWRVRCPRKDGELHRVFPGKGRRGMWPQQRVGAGGPLYYAHFRTRVWHPALKQLGLPPVTPHSARHLFISGLQAQGVEVGLVSKLAGHANANVTLGHYTQAVRGGKEAVERLALAYQASDGAPQHVTAE